jgi:hypothetical protein
MRARKQWSPMRNHYAGPRRQALGVKIRAPWVCAAATSTLPRCMRQRQGSWLSCARTTYGWILDGRGSVVARARACNNHRPRAGVERQRQRWLTLARHGRAPLRFSSPPSAGTSIIPRARATASRGPCRGAFVRSRSRHGQGHTRGRPHPRRRRGSGSGSGLV